MPGTVFYIPLEQAQTPIDGEGLVNRWWTVHPEKGVAFYAQLLGYMASEGPSPQCNASEHTARRIQEKIWPECQTVKIPVVYLEHAAKEMRQLRKEHLEQRKRERESV